MDTLITRGPQPPATNAAPFWYVLVKCQGGRLSPSFIPVEYGGGGFSMLDFAIAAEELTRVDERHGLGPKGLPPLHRGVPDGPCSRR